MSDGGIVTTQVDGWTVTSNTAKNEESLRASLKPKVEAALSQAGSELGKKGAKAAAEARQAKAEEPEPQAEPETKPEVKEPAPETEPAEPAAKPESEPAPEEKAEAKPEERKPSPRHDPRARMLEATRKEAEAKRALADERRQREALESRLAALERSTRQPEPEAAPRWNGQNKPTPNDFDSYEDYLDARDQFNRASWEAELEHRSRTGAVQQAFDSQRMKFRESTLKNLDSYSDEVLSLKAEFQLDEGASPSGENWIANELFFSPETAPTLMLHFTAHPDDLQRIATLPNPRAVSREMAKLEARLEAAPTGNSPERDDDVSRAAPPVKPVAGKPYVSEATEYRPGMTLDEYVKLRKRQQHSR